MSGLSSRRAFLVSAVGTTAALAGCIGDNNDAREEAQAGGNGEGGNGNGNGNGGNGNGNGNGGNGNGGNGNGGNGGNGNSDGGNGSGDESTADIDPSEVDLPLTDHEVPLSYELAQLEADAVNGGVPKDGIPSVDEPTIEGVSTGDDMLNPGDPVFGVTIEGEARAYPQKVLVHHEITNDRIGGRNVAVTYCPLTGTAIGFDRGGVELGVSGMLVNSNLIMYDRSTESWWPQMVGSSVLGGLKGHSLREFRVVWTTWGNWKEVHPETTILTDETGHVRNYDRDPYGGYNPKSRYYKDENVLFRPRHENDDYHPKEVFIGARNADGAVAFHKDLLREEHLLEATVGGVPYLAAYHPSLDTAYVYRNPDEVAVERVDGGYRGSDGETRAADALPLTSVNAFDTMWFPWYGFFPETEVVA